MNKLLRYTIRVYLVALVVVLSVATYLKVFEPIEVYANTSEIKVSVDGEYINFDVPPTNDNGSIFVPMRAIFEALGYEVSWDNELQMVNALLVEENYLVKITLAGEDTMFITYKEYITEYTDLTLKGVTPWERLKDEMSTNFSYEKTFSPSYKNVNGRVLVPVRAISEGTGAEVSWDGKNQTVIIDTSNPIITNPKTGVRYDVNNAGKRVEKYFDNQENTNITDNNDTNNANNNNIVNNGNQTSQEFTREEKELEIVRLVNIERVNAGLNELEIADDLMYVARWHADETVELDYFSHMSPTYNLQHTQLAKALGAEYRYVGENLYGGSVEPSKAMEGWLESSGHKAHILNPKHKYIGVGYSYHSNNNSGRWSLFMGY